MVSTRELPASVLVTCTQNAVRSPMAEALLRHYIGRKVYVESAGVVKGQTDPFMQAALEEIGLDAARHRPRSFDELEDGSFDLIISLSPEAHHKAMEMTRTMACEVEYWPTMDPTLAEGSREQRMEAYRCVRDQLETRIRKRFAGSGSGPM